MSRRVPEALQQFGGAAGRAELAAVSSARAVDLAASAGRAVRALPRTYLQPALLPDWRARAAAALLYAGEDAALSHVTALRVWGLPVPDSPRTHVQVPHGRRPRTASPFPVVVTVHRTRRPVPGRTLDGLRVVPVERAVVESWPLLEGPDQRAPVLVAVRRRLTTPARLGRELRAHPGLKGGAAIAALVALVAAGCHSELELWGHQHVFTGELFAHLEPQVPVTVRGRRSYLDLYDPAAALDIELDGRAFHDGPADRERDLARDARLAEVGVLTLRFPHRRLVQDPAGCRDQVERVAAVRREQLAGRVVVLP